LTIQYSWYIRKEKKVKLINTTWKNASAFTPKSRNSFKSEETSALEKLIFAQGHLQLIFIACFFGSGL